MSDIVSLHVGYEKGNMNIDHYPEYQYSGPGFQIRTVEDLCTLDSVLKLRNEVYSDPKFEYTKSLWVRNGREIDEWDDCSVCMVYKEASEILAAIRLTKDIHGLPCNNSYGNNSIDELCDGRTLAEPTRFVANKDGRGRGVSGAMIYHLIKYGKQIGIDTYLLTVVDVHVPFYLRMNAKVLFRDQNKTFNRSTVLMRLDLDTARLDVLNRSF